MELPVKDLNKSYQVIVLGGGVAGCHAALAAARQGACVLVVEQHGFLGGALTGMGVGPMMSFHNRAGRQLIYGSPQQMIDRLIAKGGSTGHIPDSTGYCSTVTPFDAETLKVTLDEMLAEAGAEVLLHTRLIEVVRRNDAIDAVVVHNRGGLQRIRGSVFIDATGDAELARLSKIPFTLGRESDSKTQPLTMNVRIGNVDSHRLREYIHAHWEQFADPIRTGERASLLTTTPRVSMWGFYDHWSEAKRRGEVTIPRSDVLFFETNTPGEYIFNTSRVLGVDPTDPAALSRAEAEGRRQAQEIFRFLHRHAPGFDQAVMIGTPAHVGIRESRHPHASHMLTAEDLLSERRVDHTVALGGYPIDIHSPDGQQTHTRHLPDDGCYHIPMESLTTDKLSNLLLAGRAIGADHHASAAIRVTPIAMATGQAAGTMAGLSIGNDVRTIDYGKLSELLIDAGVKLEF